VGKGTSSVRLEEFRIERNFFILKFELSAISTDQKFVRSGSCLRDNSMKFREKLRERKAVEKEGDG
jgi:hypothetical protein